MKCYDCHAETSDFVMEQRQVSGGDGVVYAGDFQDRPVHANRRDCLAEKEKAKITAARARDPFYDVPDSGA